MSLNALVPMLPVASLAASVPFYEKLGFTVQERNDTWGWASLRCGNAQLMLDQSIRLHAGIPKLSVLYLYPDDVHAFHDRARRNGLVVPDIDATFYDMDEFRIEDPDGNRLWIGQPARASNVA